MRDSLDFTTGTTELLLTMQIENHKPPTIHRGVGRLGALRYDGPPVTLQDLERAIPERASGR